MKMAYGQVGQQSAEIEQHENLGTIIASLSGIYDDLEKIAQRLMGAADSINGSAPRAGATGGDANRGAPTPPAGHLQNLKRQRAALHSIISDISQELTRIEHGLVG